MTDHSPRHLEKNQLRQWLEAVSARGLSSGALHTATSEVRTLVDTLPFQVRVLTHLRNKPKQFNQDQPKANPFLPYDQELYVAHLSTGHVLLLNKYNVVKNHFLIVTPTFEAQDSLLAKKEFSALAQASSEFPMLFFYNSSPVAGASQPHKHLQVIPLGKLPFDDAIESAIATAGSTPFRSSQLPFKHQIVKFDLEKKQGEQAREWYSKYLGLLHKLDLLDSGNIASDKKVKPLPHNLLITREWMMVVPRIAGKHQGISVNALGFAGLLLVKDQERLDRLIRLRPSELLKQVTTS